MQRMYRNIAAVLMALLTASLLASSALAAGGIGVAPTSLTVTDAVRQGIYEQSIIVMNVGDEEMAYGLNATGGAGSWISFFQMDKPDTTIDRIDLAGKMNREVGVKLSIPSDAADGDHRAVIAVTSISAGSTGVSVGISASVNVDITVTGTQIISGHVDYMDIANVEVGYPLLISVNVVNTGNVVVTPVINVDITQNKTDVDTFSINNVEIGAQKNTVIPVKWDTTGKSAADYNAHVVVSMEGKIIGEQNLSFSILQLGTLTRSGELKDLAVIGNPTTKLMGKVIATFVNTGQIATWATFTGEIYLNNNLVQTIQSDKMLIEIGQTVTLDAYFKPDKAGNYVIKGQVNYEGKESEVKTLAVTIKASGSTGFLSISSNIIYVIAGLLVVAALTPFFLVKYRGRRKIAR